MIYIFGCMDTSISQDEDGAALLLDRGTGPDDCLYVGESFLESLQVQQWSVSFRCDLRNLLRISEVQDHQEYLVKQPLANSE